MKQGTTKDKEGGRNSSPQSCVLSIICPKGFSSHQVQMTLFLGVAELVLPTLARKEASQVLINAVTGCQETVHGFKRLEV